MTVTALVSGGKDSIYAAYLADTQGWPVDELLVVEPSDPESRLLHTPNLGWVALQAEAWGKRHRTVRVEEPGDRGELAALARAVGGVDGPLVCGAIASSFQWARLVRIASDAGRRLYAPLWRKDPRRVVEEEIAAGLDIRFVHLAAEGLDPALLGERLTPATLARLERLASAGPAVHLAGEGGEYETLVLDAPFFRAELVVDDAETTRTASTASWSVRSAHLKRKPG